MYHYATVSKALDELNETPHILTCMNRILQNPQNMRIKHYLPQKEILILR
jgi:hypothetical protein